MHTWWNCSTHTGAPQAFTFASFIASCSAALGKPVQSQLAVMGDKQLSAMARAAIVDERNTVLISAASVWEIATKYVN